MADLTIVTLSRNQEYFERLDDALREQDGGPFMRCILVNNSGDPRLTAAALRRDWQVIEPGYNTSFSAGNNLAMSAAGDAGHVLLLNDDIIPEPIFLRELWRQRETADILGALLLHTDGTVNHAGVHVMPRQIDHIGRFSDPLHFRGACRLVAAVTFAAVLIRRSLWDKLGGLHEGYYYGWEDIDFCMQALEAGATIRCCGDAVAVHDECGTRPRGLDEMGKDNYRLHMRRWESKTAELLADYCRRMRPETVEGV
jgi:GT2 family glycosyltransferase